MMLNAFSIATTKLNAQIESAERLLRVMPGGQRASANVDDILGKDSLDFGYSLMLRQDRIAVCQIPAEGWEIKVVEFITDCHFERRIDFAQKIPELIRDAESIEPEVIADIEKASREIEKTIARFE